MERNQDKHLLLDTSLEGEQPRKRPRTSAKLAREVGLMRSVPGDKFTGFVGSASGIFFIRSVYDAIRRSQPAVSTVSDTPASDIVPGEDDRLPLVQPDSAERLWKDYEIAPSSLLHAAFPDLVAFSASYFANWHPFYPFLHAPAVLEFIREFSHSGCTDYNNSEDLRLVVLRSIISISLADHRQSPHPGLTPYPPRLIFLTYDAAVDSLRHVLLRPATLLTLQAAISIQLFLVSMLRLNAASRLGGLIIRMAVQLGLHRCPARFSSFSLHERELRQRVFWSVYAIDRFICQSMGLPLGLHDDDVDVCFPLAEKHLQTQVEHGMLLQTVSTV